MDKEQITQLDYRNCPEFRDKLKGANKGNSKKVVKKGSADEKSSGSCED